MCQVNEPRKGAAPVSELERLRNRVAEIERLLRWHANRLTWVARKQLAMQHAADQLFGVRPPERNDLAEHIAAGRVVVAAPLGEEELDPVVPAAGAVIPETKTVDIFVLDETSADRMHRMLLDLGLVYQPLDPLGDGSFKRFLVSRTHGFTRFTVRFVPCPVTEEQPR